MPKKKPQKAKVMHRERGEVFVLVRGLGMAVICFMLLWSFSGAFAQSPNETDTPNEQFYSRAADWVGEAASNVKNWVQKQAEKVVAVFRGQDVAEITTGQVLGETIDETQQSSPQEQQDTIFTVPLSSYGASVINQSSNTVVAAPGAELNFSAAFTNTGEASWENQVVSLNTFGLNESQLFSHSSWTTPRRPASVIGTVIPQDQYVFNFLASAPQTPGSYELLVRPVIFLNGTFNWVGGTENIISWQVQVQEPVQEQVINEPEPVAEEIVVDEADETPLPEPESDPSPVQELVEEAPQEVPDIEKTSQQAAPIIIHGVDGVAPTSQVTELSATTTSASFDVAWDGVDNQRGDITLRFDVQYQVDSGDWTDWVLETTLMTSLFTGSDEKTYSFRTRARDPEGNWEEYPEIYDARTYLNLSVPSNPAVTSHTSGGTVTGDDDEDAGTINTQITLSGTGDPNDTLVITLAETSTTATTTIGVGGTWSQQFTFAEEANTFSLQASEADGDTSTTVAFNLTLELEPTLDVVINEVAWMGTASNAVDEWLELYNASSTAIDLTDWTLKNNDASLSITLDAATCTNRTIAAKGYLLLERTDDTTVNNITADCIYTGALSNSGERLTLRNSASTLVDRVGSTTASWFAGNDGTKATMERINPGTYGTESSNWANNDGTLTNGQDSASASLTATPGGLNSVNTTIPRTITGLTFQYIYTTATSVRLYWTAPKTANLATTTPATYDIRYSTASITDANFSSATAVTGEPTPSTTQGTVQTYTVEGLSPSTQYFFAIKTNNGVEDSLVSNSPDVTTNATGTYGLTLAGFPSGTGGLVASTSSPVYVSASITVANGETLTIQPGTVLKFKQGSSLNITIQDGGALVMGDSSDSINGVVITSERDDAYGGDTNNNGDANSPAAGDWGRITASGSSATVTIDNGIIRNGGSPSNMIALASGTTGIIRTSIIENSNSFGISISADATSLTLTDSTVRNNLDGLGISTLANATVTGTTFTGHRRGVTIDTNADPTNLIFTGNNFYANNTVSGGDPTTGFQYGDADDLLPAANLANSWWGSVSGPTEDTHSTGDDRDGIIDDEDGTLTQVGWPVTFATSQITIKPENL